MFSLFSRLNLRNYYYFLINLRWGIKRSKETAHPSIWSPQEPWLPLHLSILKCYMYIKHEESAPFMMRAWHGNFCPPTGKWHVESDFRLNSIIQMLKTSIFFPLPSMLSNLKKTKNVPVDFLRATCHSCPFKILDLINCLVFLV